MTEATDAEREAFALMLGEVYVRSVDSGMGGLGSEAYEQLMRATLTEKYGGEDGVFKEFERLFGTREAATEWISAFAEKLKRKTAEQNRRTFASEMGRRKPLPLRRRT